MEQVRGAGFAPRRTILARIIGRVLLAAALCAALILVSIAHIDRPVALFMAAHVHDRIPFIAMAAIANLPVPLAVVYLVGLVAARWRGATFKTSQRLFITLAVTVLAAVMIKNQLKFDFGRIWPLSVPFPGVRNDPSFIGNHVFGFFPFHGGASYSSFPSGHTTAITAPMAVLWARVPRYRLIWGGLIAIVVAGLIGADFHFVSDTIAGFFLGAAVASGAVYLTNRYLY